ncbi:hypothetical protein T06_15465 [Trichinella sp. T6]|nr:hypothetical protein T06_15465 [Trichinella sp. T6]
MPLQPISDQPITKMCRIFADEFRLNCCWLVKNKNQIMIKIITENVDH